MKGKRGGGSFKFEQRLKQGASQDMRCSKKATIHKNEASVVSSWFIGGKIGENPTQEEKKRYLPAQGKNGGDLAGKETSTHY